MKETFIGREDLTHVRIAFPAGSLPVESGEEVLFFLMQHPQEPLFVVGWNLPYYQSTIGKNRDDYFFGSLAEVQHSASLLKNGKGLESEDANERLHTASLLMLRARDSRRLSSTTKFDLSEAQSKTVLQLLAEPEAWNNVDRSTGHSRSSLFALLNVRPVGTDENAFVAWLKANGGKYRIEGIEGKN